MNLYSNFNDLLSNETYQRDKYMLGVLNTKIKEMLGESMQKRDPDTTPSEWDDEPDDTDYDDEDEDTFGHPAGRKNAKKKSVKEAVQKQAVKQSSKVMTNKKTTEAADKKPSSWTDKSGKSHSATKVTGKNYKGDVAEKEKKAKKKVKESNIRHNLYANFINEGINRYINEDEEGKAKSITAAADMVNDFTGWMQRVGNYQTKSMIELADNIRANFGMQEAEQFKQAVGQALEGALNALTSAREEINNAVAVLAGEAPGEEQMGMDPAADPEMDAAAGNFDEPGMDDSMDALNPSADDEFAASDAAAGGSDTTGRAMREHIEKGNRLMRILGS